MISTTEEQRGCGLDLQDAGKCVAQAAAKAAKFPSRICGTMVQRVEYQVILRENFRFKIRNGQARKLTTIVVFVALIAVAMMALVMPSKTFAQFEAREVTWQVVDIRGSTLAEIPSSMHGSVAAIQDGTKLVATLGPPSIAAMRFIPPPADSGDLLSNFVVNTKENEGRDHRGNDKRYCAFPTNDLPLCDTRFTLRMIGGAVFVAAVIIFHRGMWIWYFGFRGRENVFSTSVAFVLISVGVGLLYLSVGIVTTVVERPPQFSFGRSPARTTTAVFVNWSSK